MRELEDDLRVLRVVVGVPCHQQRLVALVAHHLHMRQHQPDQKLIFTFNFCIADATPATASSGNQSDFQISQCKCR